METSKFVLQLIGQLADAADEYQARQKLQDLTSCLGLDSYMYGIQLEGPLGPERLVISGYPPHWQKRYADAGYAEVDPTLQRALETYEPFLWSECPATSESAQFWQEARASGVGYGLSIPIHEHRGLRAMLSMARGTPWTSAPPGVLVQCVRMVAMATHQFAQRCLIPGLCKSLQSAVTARELECLDLAYRGLSSDQIGQQLGITPRTVDYHFAQVQKRLGCRSRIEAVAKSASSGLVPLQ